MRRENTCRAASQKSQASHPHEAVLSGDAELRLQAAIEVIAD